MTLEEEVARLEVLFWGADVGTGVREQYGIPFYVIPDPSPEPDHIVEEKADGDPI